MTTYGGSLPVRRASPSRLSSLFIGEKFVGGLAPALTSFLAGQRPTTAMAKTVPAPRPPFYPPSTHTKRMLSGHWHKGHRERAGDRARSDALGVVAKRPGHEGQPGGSRVPEAVLGVHPADRRVADAHLPKKPRHRDEAISVRGHDYFD